MSFTLEQSVCVFLERTAGGSCCKKTALCDVGTWFYFLDGGWGAEKFESFGGNAPSGAWFVGDAKRRLGP